MVSVTSQRFGSGLETLPEVLKLSADTPEVPEVVGRPSRRSGSGRETFRRSEVVGRPSRISGNGRETLPEVQKWS